eukprot:g711.t1
MASSELLKRRDDVRIALSNAIRDEDVVRIKVLKLKLERLDDRIAKKRKRESKENAADVFFCDGCRAPFGVGQSRYDCPTCPQEEAFSLCSTCHLLVDHEHALVKTSAKEHMSSIAASSFPAVVQEGHDVAASDDIDKQIARLEAELNADDEKDAPQRKKRKKKKKKKKNVGSDVSENEAQYRCFVCSETFSTVNALDAHVVGDAHRTRAVQAMRTESYVPAERRAMYCRVCRLGFVSVEELTEHRSTKMHSSALRTERRASYCRVCEKQFTSVIQLDEHDEDGAAAGEDFAGGEVDEAEVAGEGEGGSGSSQCACCAYTN